MFLSPNKRRGNSLVIFVAAAVCLSFLLNGVAAAANPVSWWKMDETTGTTAADSSGNGHNGTLNGTALTALVWMPTSGISGGAIKFDAAVSGSKDMRIDVPAAGLSTSAGTVAFWTKLTEPQYRAGGRNGVAYFFGCGSTTANRIGLLMSTFDTQLDAELGSSSSLNITTLSTAVWYHLALVWNGTNYYVYVNGSEVTSGAGSISSLASTAAIGNKGASPAQSMDGMVDDVRFYGTALSAGEVYNLYGGSGDPSPANGAIDIDINTDLSWTAGNGAVSHNVYFGTVNPPAARGNQTATTFEPGSLVASVQYYWRIDEVRSGDVLTGKLWSFTALALPAQATATSPSNSAIDISLTADLNWTAGARAASHNVYFGTANPPPFIRNQTAVTYDTGTLNHSTAYYWRINEANTSGTTTGTVWSFVTITAKAGNPVPANSAVEVPIETDLVWTSGYGATSHDVYFGTANPPAFIKNQTANIYTPGSGALADWSDIENMANWWLNSTCSAGNGWCNGADVDKLGSVNLADFAMLAQDWLTIGGGENLEFNTTYYWRIDERGSGDAVTTGNLWSFKTEVYTLVLYYPLDEGTGSVAHDMGRLGNNGVVRDGAVFVSNGVDGGCIDSPGIYDRIEYPTKDMSINAGTVALWFKLYPAELEGDTIYDYMFTCTEGTSRMQIYFNGKNTNLNLGLGDKLERYLNIIPMSRQVWYHVALTWDHGQYVFYVNGNQKIVSGTYTGLTAFPVKGSIGNNSYENKQGFSGWIDEVVIHNRALNAAEILELYGATRAKNPNPANWSSNAPLDKTLSWTAGAGATGHDVYFGTSSVLRTGDFKGTVTGTSFDPGPLTRKTTYYWRVDENNGGADPVKGNLWRFSTVTLDPPYPAESPYPSSGASNVFPTADVIWTAGFEAASHNVYFGTANPPPFIGNQSAARYDPGQMVQTTTYYWQIDEVNPFGTTAGPLWSFTTGTNPPPPPAGVVGWWKLDEGAGDFAYDYSGNNNHGQLFGPTWSVGKSGGCLKFDSSSNSYVLVPHNSAIEFTTGSFSVTYWSKGGSFGRTVEKGTEGTPDDPGSGRRYQFYYNMMYDQFRFCIDDDIAKSQASTDIGLFSSSDWILVAGVRDTSDKQVKLYRNADKVAVAADNCGNIASGEDLMFGNGGAGLPYDFNGYIDDIRLYNRALTGSEIATLYDPRMAGNPTPVDGVRNTGTNVTLSWTAGVGATAHDVYFGTNSVPDPNQFKGTQTATTFDPRPLANGTYYWRIDEKVSGGGVVRGAIWMFTTTAGPTNLRIACTEESLKAALATVGANPEGGTITFSCTNAEIKLFDRLYFYGNNMTLDGEDRGILFTYTGPDPCNNDEGHDPLIEIYGNNNILRNFSMFEMRDGIQFRNGFDNMAEYINTLQGCEDTYVNSGSEFTADRTVVRNCYLQGSSDKAIMNNGGHMLIKDCIFENCTKSLRCQGGGIMSAEGNTYINSGNEYSGDCTVVPWPYPYPP